MLACGGRAFQRIPVLAGKSRTVPQQKGGVVAALKLKHLSKSINMLIQIAHILQQVLSYSKLFVEWFSGMNHYVNVHFGLFVQLALDLLILYIICMVIYQIIKLSFRILFRIVIPSVILAGVVVFFASYSFLNILPIFVCILVAINLIRP
jgi:hypothetical protein